MFNFADFEAGGDDEGAFKLISASIVVNHVNQLSTAIKAGGTNIMLDKRCMRRSNDLLRSYNRHAIY